MTARVSSRWIYSRLNPPNPVSKYTDIACGSEKATHAQVAERIVERYPHLGRYCGGGCLSLMLRTVDWGSYPFFPMNVGVRLQRRFDPSPYDLENQPADGYPQDQQSCFRGSLRWIHSNKLLAEEPGSEGDQS